jgi:protein-tyrosine-phosphatase
MVQLRLLVLAFLLLATTATQVAAQTDRELAAKANNALVTALAFSHRYALPRSLTADEDRQLKIRLIAALGKSRELRWEAVNDLFDKNTFEKLAGGGTTITLEKMERVMDQVPHRGDLNAKTRQHCDLLTTQFDLIEAVHREPAKQLVAWIVENYESGKPLGIIIICTGNTRRSMLGATMGNIAAAYHGLPNIRFFSGGTDPVAFNPRTIATLKQIGVEIEKSGKEAPNGTAGEANPIYHVRLGKGLETVEYSKKYTDAANPQKDFAAILVCSEADASCPKVTGANVRISVPYLDPKVFDGAPFEAEKYAERRDDIGRFMLSVFMQARRRLELDGKLK